MADHETTWLSPEIPQHGQIRMNSDLSEPFPITNGVKQGCVLAPTLFSIFFSMMLKHDDEDFAALGITWRATCLASDGCKPTQRLMRD